MPQTATEYAISNNKIFDQSETESKCPSEFGIQCKGEDECNWDYQSISCTQCWNSELRKG